jgi:PAS domain S-box-containing protein
MEAVVRRRLTTAGPDPIPTAPVGTAREEDDPALLAVRAIVGAAWRPIAVFDQDGTCLIASRSFILDATRGRQNAAAVRQRRRSFSPDGRRSWTLVSYATKRSEHSASDFFDSVADALPMMFNAKDTDSRYLLMNRYQADLYGVCPEQVLGRTAGELLGATYGKYTRSIDAEVIRTGRPMPLFEERYAGVDGVVRDWLTTKVPLRHADGTVWGIATVAIDITERKRLEERLRAAKEQAEEGSRAKSRFLGAMSHELRTPLNAVLGFAELLRDESLGPLGNPRYREYAQHIHRSGTQLLEQIGDLLDYARADSGSLQLSSSTVEMGRLVRGVLAAERERVEASAQGLRVTLTEDMPAGFLALRGDEERLRQAVRALIGNALKFTPAGGRIHVRLAPGRDGGAELAVSDTGIGLAADEIEHLFEPFWQADAGLGRRREGMGIGLKLARALVGLHGGSLAVDSCKDEGTTVTLRLPQVPPEDEPSPDEHAAA